MKTSWRIARLSGINVQVHVTFLLLVLWIALVDYQQHRSWPSVSIEVGFIALLFASIVLHELGHALTARHFGITTRDITLLPIGGIARLSRIPSKPIQELLVAAAGPAVNVIIAAILFLFLALRDGLGALLDFQTMLHSFVARLAWMNVGLTLFNLIPAFPMDGGRVLRAILALKLDYLRATRIAVGIGQGLAVVAGIVGLSTNPLLVIIAILVWFGAAEEFAVLQFKSTLIGTPVRSLMRTEFRSLAPSDSLGQAVDQAVATGQRDFPVVEAGRIVGILRHTDLLQALAATGPATPVGDAMRRHFQTAVASDDAGSAWEKLRDEECQVVPVVKDGELVGLFSDQNLAEFVLTHSSSGRFGTMAGQTH